VKKSQLIELLQKLPEDAEVVIRGGDHSFDTVEVGYGYAQKERNDLFEWDGVTHPKVPVIIIQ
jgi:hypothetical protein